MAKKILVVDDEVEVVEIIKKKLKGLGYEIFVAFNGEDALDVLDQEPLDLILTDLVMPGIDGDMLIKILKKSKVLEHIPVIVISAYANKENTARNLGADDFLIKPFDFQTMLETIERIFLQYRNFNRYYRILIYSFAEIELKNLSQELKDRGMKVEVKFIKDDFTLMVEALNTKPDVVVIDVLSEGANPFKLIRTLRSYAIFKNLIILAYGKPKISPAKGKDEKALEEIKKFCYLNGASRYISSLDSNMFWSILCGNPDGSIP